MEVTKKLRGVPKGRAAALGLEVVQLGLAIVVRGHSDLIEQLGGHPEPLTDYDWFKLGVGGDEWHFYPLNVDPVPE